MRIVHGSVFVLLTIVEDEPQTPEVFADHLAAKLRFDDLAAADGLHVISVHPDEEPELLRHEPKGTLAVAGDDVQSIHLIEVPLS